MISKIYTLSQTENAGARNEIWGVPPKYSHSLNISENNFLENIYVAKELVPMLCNPSQCLKSTVSYTLYDTHRLLQWESPYRLHRSPEGDRVIPSWFLPLLPAHKCKYIPVVSARAVPQRARTKWRVSPTEEPVAGNKTKEFGYNNETHPLLTSIPPLPFVLTRDFDMIIQ